MNETMEVHLEAAQKLTREIAKVIDDSGCKNLGEMSMAMLVVLSGACAAFGVTLESVTSAMVPYIESLSGSAPGSSVY